MTKENPFIFGPPVPPEKFIDREAEVNFILDRLSNPHNRGGSMVSGPSGIGKTSLLHYLCAKKIQKKWQGFDPKITRFVYMPTDLISPFSEIKFWEYLFADIADWLNPPSDLEKIGETLELRQVPTRFDICKFFTRLGTEKGKFVVVLLEGFDLLIKEINLNNADTGMAFLHTLRALLNLPSPRGFSIITSSQNELIELFGNIPWFGSSFYSTMANLKLAPFQRTQIDTLLDSYLRGTGIIFDDNDRKFLEETSLGHPRELQQAAFRLFENKRRAQDNEDKDSKKDDKEPEVLGAPPLRVNFTEFDVFLCHNSQDKPMVEAIARELIRCDLKPWLDKWHLLPGRRFAEEIERVLPKIKSAAVFVGQSGIGPWQKQEMYAALGLFTENERPIIPVLLPGVDKEPDNVPLLLRQFSWIRFNQLYDQEAIDNLIWGITGEHPREDVLYADLINAISEACCLLIKTIQDVFGIEDIKPPAVIKQIDTLKAILKGLEPICEEFETNEINSLVTQLKQHTNTRQAYLQEESNASPVVRPLVIQARKTEEDTLKNIILSLKHRLEELTNQAIECGLE